MDCFDHQVERVARVARPGPSGFACVDDASLKNLSKSKGVSRMLEKDESPEGMSL